MSVVGEMLKHSVNGLMQLLNARSTIKNQFRMNVTTIKPVENNPLKFSMTLEDALETLLVKESPAYLAPLEAVRDGVKDIADHQMAMIAGMRAAYKELLGRFDPKHLQAQFDREGGSGLFKNAKAQYWEHYEAFFAEANDASDETFQRLFGDDFAEAYEQQLQHLQSMRQGEY